MATATAATIETTVLTIDMLDIKKTYRGQTGCACGCGGNYFDFDSIDSNEIAENAKRVKYVLRGIREGRAQFFRTGVEVANPSYTQVTRLYFKDGIRYEQFVSGRIERSEKVGA